MSRSEGRLRHRPMTVADPGSQALRSGVNFSVSGQLDGWAESELQMGGSNSGVGMGGRELNKNGGSHAITVNLLPALNSS